MNNAIDITNKLMSMTKLELYSLKMSTDNEKFRGIIQDVIDTNNERFYPCDKAHLQSIILAFQPK